MKTLGFGTFTGTGSKVVELLGYNFGYPLSIFWILGGTGPNFTFQVNASPDGTNAFVVLASAVQTATGSSLIATGPVARYLSLNITAASGTNPTLTVYFGFRE